MKTPEEMAIDYCEPILSDDYARAIGREDWIGTRCVKVGEGHEMYKAFLAGYKAARNETNLPTSAKWISVHERLPEMNELCIVNTEWRGIVVATYGNESWIFDDGQGWSEKALSYASYWMELPAPPKEEK